jgi:hypothetical protein
MAFLKRYLTDVTQSPGTPAGKRQETRFCKLLKINALAILPSPAGLLDGRPPARVPGDCVTSVI